MSVRSDFLPYGPAYDEVLQFFDMDDGYSHNMYFKQNFLVGCDRFRRFWVCWWCWVIVTTQC